MNVTQDPAKLSATAPIRPSYMAHFVLHTNQRPEMVAWYKTLLGAWEVFGNDKMTFLTFDNEHHRLVISDHGPRNKPDPKAWGIAHIAYSYPSLAILLENYRRLKEAGILPTRAINHGPSTSFYYRDPDGTNIELQTDNFANVEAAHEFMHGDEFEENPVGVLFDPDKFIEQLESGIPEAELKKRPRS